MKRFYGFLPVLLAVTLLGACATLFQTPKDPWVGVSKDELVKQSGNPSSVKPDGRGGEIWVYSKSKMIEGHALGSSSGGGATNQDQVWMVNKFFIDANGIIYAHQEFQI
jgi:hypothetical protein